MGILKDKLFGSVDLGVYMAINNNFLFIPRNTPPEKIEAFHKPFNNTTSDFSIVTTSINQSSLLGVYIATNSNGILVPSIISESELMEITEYSKTYDVHIEILDSTDNALGNLILCNNYGCVISSELAENVKIIQEVLDVEVMILDYAQNKLPGSSGVTNNHGCCVHPLTSEKQAELIGEVLRVPVDVSTINMGNPYVRAGSIVNDFGGIFGYDSSGPELMRISNVLNL
ncbi:MAG: translation initiation factor IF-6 [Candidatus Lokiarchaeota archaeon]|nr:translation initiation factor IF-6 [Candidatus Lokiarchaeota archaeon]